MLNEENMIKNSQDMNSQTVPANHRGRSGPYNYNETKLCVIIDSRTPIIMRVPIAPTDITLSQFKQITSLQSSNYKFYFKSFDSEFGIGVVKEEVVDDSSTLPHEEDRIVAWVISEDTSSSILFDDRGTNELNPIGNVNTSRHDPPVPPEFQAEDAQYINVQFTLDNYNFLGLTLVGPSDEVGIDKGLYVGEIANNSVCQRDGRIEVGDKIVEINGIDIRNMDNDDAVAAFKNCVQRRGLIRVVLIRHLNVDAYKKGRFTLPREYANAFNSSSTAQRQLVAPQHHGNTFPIPMLELQQTATIKPRYRKPDRLVPSEYHSLPRSVTPRSLYAASNFTEHVQTYQDICQPLDSRSAYEPSTPTAIRQVDVPIHCTRDNIHTIYNALRSDSKSLDIKDREWLKVVIKDAFLGSCLVKWLQRNVYGFSHKRDIKRYANGLLTEGFIKNPIRHPSNTFSAKCYYTLS